MTLNSTATVVDKSNAKWAGWQWLLIVLCLSAACGVQSAIPRFVTWESPEPDIWASIWLINRHIEPRAEVMISQPGSPVFDAVAFGVPGAQYRRGAEKSTYETLLEGYTLEEPRLKKMGAVIHAIEITRWTSGYRREAQIVERAFRLLREQLNYNVPPACYNEFFDRLYSVIGHADVRQLQKVMGDVAAIRTECKGEVTKSVRRTDKHNVLHLEIADILERIGRGERVVFIDVREPFEYDENHIPGAINLQLRNINKDVKQLFDDADLVVSYCIKDFRGFEVARALSILGVEPVATMLPHGIAGWNQLQLPVFVAGLNAEDDALKQLKRCAESIQHCNQP